MKNPNIILIGMAGTSKSTTGKLLAAKKNMLFLDSDRRFVEQFGNISEFFERNGEGAFRVEEGRILYDLSLKSGAVIATGGGAVLNPAMSYLASSGIVVLLTAGDETIYERLKDDNSRPLLKDNAKEKIAALQRERAPLYKKWAKVTVATDALTPEQTADMIAALTAPIIAAMSVEDKD